MVETMAQQYPVRELCALLEVTRSGYYAWHNGRETARDIANRLWTERIRGVYHPKKGRYGSPRVTEQLRREGHRCNHKRVERLMRQQGLKGCSSRKRRVCTTNSEHDQPIAPNLLLNRPAPSRCNEVWVADITYVPTAQGWLFVAAVMDLYSRQIVGWSVWESLEAGGALQALQRAMTNLLVVHKIGGRETSLLTTRPGDETSPPLSRTAQSRSVPKLGGLAWKKGKNHAETPSRQEKWELGLRTTKRRSELHYVLRRQPDLNGSPNSNFDRLKPWHKKGAPDMDAPKLESLLLDPSKQVVNQKRRLSHAWP